MTTPATLAPNPAEEAKHAAALLRGRKITAIKATVANHFDIDVLDLIRKRRTEPLATIRQMAMVLARELVPSTSVEVAAAFDRGDHCTVLHAERAVAAKVETDSDTRINFGQLKTKCRRALAQTK